MRNPTKVLLALLAFLMFIPLDAMAQRRGGGGGLGNAARGIGGAVGVELPDEIQEKRLLPSQVHNAFSPLDEANPFAGNDALQYYETGIAHYDQFFLSVAQLRGTLEIARYTLQLANQTLDSGIVDSVLSGELLAEIVGPEANLSEAERRQLTMSLVTGNFAAARTMAPNLTEDRLNNIRESAMDAHENIRPLQTYMPAAMEALTAIPTQATALTNSSQALVTSAPSDFAGPNAVNLPRITNELTRSVTSLTEIPAASVEVLSELRSLIPGQ